MKRKKLRNYFEEPVTMAILSKSLNDAFFPKHESGVEPGLDRQESVLAEAERLINGDRAKSYGHPYFDYQRTVRAFNALTGHQLSVKDGVLFMVCVKLSREQNLPKRDNLVDAAGYIGCLEKVIDKEEELKLEGGEC